MSGNEHLGRPVHTWGEDRHAADVAVLAVHGRGQTPAFMQQATAPISTPGLRYYAPHAAGDTWYPEPFLVPIEKNQPQLDNAMEAVQACLARIEKDGFAQRQIALLGFSQGACLVSHLAVTRRVKVGALVIFTGGYVGADTIPPPPGRPLDGTPALIRSIDNDPWVPPGRVWETAEVLTAMGATVDLHIAQGNEHIITEEATDAASRLLDTLRH